MIKGTYRIFSGEKLVSEKDNALTVVGRTIAIKSLLGIIPSFAGSIAYGLGDKANSVSASTSLILDNSLQFELGRAAVVGSTLEVTGTNDALIYTATIDDPYEYTIHEVGLFPAEFLEANVGLAGSTILDFDRVDLFNKFGTASASGLVEAVEARLGTELFELPTTDGVDSYLSYASSDNTLSIIDQYVSEDTFRLAGLDLNVSSASVAVEFYTEDNGYYQLVFRTPSSSGYFISEVQKGQANIIGTPDWNNINLIKIWQNGAQRVYLDGLRIDFGSYLLDTTTGMISRAVLPSPIRKPAGIPLTIEYALTLDFNGGI